MEPQLDVALGWLAKQQGEMERMIGTLVSENSHSPEVARCDRVADLLRECFAMPSRTSKGATRIVPFLKQGAGVVTTRAHVHHVVTEYGSVCLFGKNLHQRALALASIAHPDDREALQQSIRERFGR